MGRFRRKTKKGNTNANGRVSKPLIDWGQSMKAQELQGETQQKEFSELLEKINANSKDGLREFYEKYGKLIACTAAIFFKNQFLVDEIVNEVLIKIWKKSKYDCKIDNPKGWIYVITANCAKL